MQALLLTIPLFALLIGIYVFGFKMLRYIWREINDKKKLK